MIHVLLFLYSCAKILGKTTNTSIGKAAYRAINHGISAPAGKNALPSVSPTLLIEEK